MIPQVCSAQFAADYATASAYADGWQAGDNGGYGFTPWSFSVTGGTPPQWTMNSSSAYNQLGTAWAVYSASGAEVVKATRGFSAPLQPGQTVSITFDNPSGALMDYHGFAVGLLSGGVERVSVWRYAYPWYWEGAGGNPYGQWQAGASSALTTLTEAQTSQGVNLDITLTDPSTYALTMTPFGHPELAYSLAGPLAGSGGIDQLQFSFWGIPHLADGSGDFFISGMAIVPEPSTLALLGLGGLLFLPRRK